MPDDLIDRAAALCAQREAGAPWIAGTTSVVLARELGLEEPTLVRALTAAVAAGRLAKQAGWYTTPAYAPRLTAEQAALFAELVPDRPGDLLPVSHAAVAVAVRRSPVHGAQAAFDALLGLARLVRIGDHLYGAGQVAEIRGRLERTLAAEGAITPAQFRDLVGGSRKYAVPLLEYFDRTGLTLREGDLRRLAPKPAR